MQAGDRETAAQAQALLAAGDIEGATELLIAWRARRRIERAAEAELELRLGESLPACEALVEETQERVRAGMPDALCGDILRVTRLLAGLAPVAAAKQLGFPLAEIRRLERYDLNPIAAEDRAAAEALFHGLCVTWRRRRMRRLAVVS